MNHHLTLNTLRTSAFASLLLLGSWAQAAISTVVACLPPQCASPMAQQWPEAFGSTGFDKIAMIGASLCAWLLVLGLFMAIGHIPRRPMPIELSMNPKAAAHWRSSQESVSAQWKSMRANPDERRATRNRGLTMILSGLLIAIAVTKLTGSEKLDLSGSVARLQRWDGLAFQEEAALRLGQAGLACQMIGESCAPWGRWIANQDTLILSPANPSKTSHWLIPDESRTRYWAKPEHGDQLSFGVFLELPKRHESTIFTDKKTKGFD